MDIICTKCGSHFNSVEGCAGHVGHCEVASEGTELHFVPARGSKINKAEWDELLKFINSLNAPTGLGEKKAEAKASPVVAQKAGAKPAKPGMFRTMLGILLLVGSVASIWYFAYLSASGYQVGFLVMLAWGLGFFSLFCFAWARRKFMPFFLYGACTLWFIIAGGDNRWVYTLPYALMLGLFFFVALFLGRKKKAVGTTVSPSAKPAPGAVVCPNPRCQSSRVKVVGAGASAKRMCLDCGRTF